MNAPEGMDILRKRTNKKVGTDMYRLFLMSFVTRVCMNLLEI